ncbi:unnamed protein product [Nippostrongylus brasiliensis]|uniref:Interleukin-6 n=1 Tax=Nippostrongylus brasiliensis TaxID=27835 RepID=A0A0N4XGE5_NIPBR|nr:unnamed protein product [Nippostrongylus brasiliensis]
MQTAVFLLLLVTAVYGKPGKDDASKMLEQPALRVRRSSQEDRVHQHLSDIVVKLKHIGQSVGYSNDHSSNVKEEDRVYQHLSDFIIALKLFAKSLGSPSDPFSDVEEEARKHWSQRTMNETNLKTIANMLREHVGELENGVCIGKQKELYKFHWCPNVVRKLGEVVYQLYNLHYFLTKDTHLNSFYFDELEQFIFEKAVWHYPTREGILETLDVFLMQMGE